MNLREEQHLELNGCSTDKHWSLRFDNNHKYNQLEEIKVKFKKVLLLKKMIVADRRRNILFRKHNNFGSKIIIFIHIHQHFKFYNSNNSVIFSPSMNIKIQGLSSTVKNIATTIRNIDIN